VRRALVSVVFCLSGTGAVAAAGWSLQLVALPPPAPAARIAADVSTWLRNYRYSIDVFHADGRRLRGTCLRGWYPRHGRHLVRGSLLVLDGGPVVLDAGGRRYLRFVAGRQRRDLPAFLAVAVGCTSSLGGALYAAAEGKTHLNVQRAYAANQPALALHLPLVHDERLTLYVSPRQYRPLVAIAAAKGRVATARIYLARATLRLRSRYRRLLSGKATRPA
jgi:hypothetical protein